MITVYNFVHSSVTKLWSLHVLQILASHRKGYVHSLGPFHLLFRNRLGFVSDMNLMIGSRYFTLQQGLVNRISSVTKNVLPCIFHLHVTVIVGLHQAEVC